MRELCNSMGCVITGQSLTNESIGALIIFVLYLALILIFGEFLWNKVLCRVVTIVKPVKSIWELLGIMLLFGIIM